ncbi:MAG: hypothetical protein EOO41_05730, partial [Methanobacteriota archaeon]
MKDEAWVHAQLTPQPLATSAPATVALHVGNGAPHANVKSLSATEPAAAESTPGNPSASMSGKKRGREAASPGARSEPAAGATAPVDGGVLTATRASSAALAGTVIDLDEASPARVRTAAVPDASSTAQALAPGLAAASQVVAAPLPLPAPVALTPDPRTRAHSLALVSVTVAALKGFCGYIDAVPDTASLHSSVVDALCASGSGKLGSVTSIDPGSLGLTPPTSALGPFAHSALALALRTDFQNTAPSWTCASVDSTSMQQYAWPEVTNKLFSLLCQSSSAPLTQLSAAIAAWLAEPDTACRLPSALIAERVQLVAERKAHGCKPPTELVT